MRCIIRRFYTTWCDITASSKSRLFIQQVLSIFQASGTAIHDGNRDLFKSQSSNNYKVILQIPLKTHYCFGHSSIKLFTAHFLFSLIFHMHSYTLFRTADFLLHASGSVICSHWYIYILNSSLPLFSIFYIHSLHTTCYCNPSFYKPMLMSSLVIGPFTS